MMADLLNAKCTACGHVWTLVYLPVPINILLKFTGLPCQKCFTPKPVIAGKDDLTPVDHLLSLLSVCQQAVPHTSDAMVLWVAIAPDNNPSRQLAHVIGDDQDDAKMMCGEGWRVGKFQEVPNA